MGRGHQGCREGGSLHLEAWLDPQDDSIPDEHICLELAVGIHHSATLQHGQREEASQAMHRRGTGGSEQWRVAAVSAGRARRAHRDQDIFGSSHERGCANQEQEEAGFLAERHHPIEPPEPGCRPTLPQANIDSQACLAALEPSACCDPQQQKVCPPPALRHHFGRLERDGGGGRVFAGQQPAVAAASPQVRAWRASPGLPPAWLAVAVSLLAQRTSTGVFCLAHQLGTPAAVAVGGGGGRWRSSRAVPAVAVRRRWRWRWRQ